jgi:hypothetical protein
MHEGIGKVVVMSSYHPEYWNNKFAEKAIELSKRIPRFQVSVNMSDKPELWDNTEQLIEMLFTNGVKVRPTTLTSNNNYTVNYSDEFYARFGKYFNDTHRVIRVDCNFEDGTHKNMLYYDMERAGYDKLKGYNCTPLYFEIDKDGVMRNICTNRTVGLDLIDTNLVKAEICPRDKCLGKQLLVYHKTRP